MNKKDKIQQFRADVEWQKTAKRAAKALELTVSGLIRLAVAEKIDREASVNSHFQKRFKQAA